MKPTSSFASRQTATPAVRLRSDESGAIMVFGIFFAVLIVGMLYYYVGIAATIYLRERLQDAADASAFASAVVHARGMNTLALINMVMAAIMSILVTLRIIEALIIIAQVILYALAWLGGATAAIASALEVVRQLVSEISEEAEPIIQEIEVVLHYAGEIVSYITPIGANATVLGKVAMKYNPEVRFGVAIPSRITLPVEDDEYKYLCNKAGAMAGTLVMLPLAPLLPTKIRQKLNGAVGDLAGAGSAWFCGDENASPPSTTVEAERDSFPSSQKMKDCLDPDKKNADSVETCRQAEEIEGRGEPDRRTGECRLNAFVCERQTDEDADPPVVWEFNEETYCAQRGLTVDRITSEDCKNVTVDGREFPDPTTPYGQRLLGAREECRPDGKKKQYWWLEREVEVRWNSKTGAWEDTGRELASAKPVKEGKDSTRAPCDEVELFRGSDQWAPATDMWNTGNLTKPVCYVDPPAPMAQGGGGTASRREVTQVLGCSAEVAPQRIQAVRPLNLSEDKLRASPGIGNVSQDGQSSSGVGGQFKDVTMEDMQELKSMGLENLAGGQGLAQSGGGSQGGGSFGGLGGASAGGSSAGGSSTGAGGAGGAGAGGAGGSAAGGGGANGGGGGSDQDDMTPFRFEKSHLLGTSDMQIRSLVVGYGLSETELNGKMDAPEPGKTAHSHAKRIVELSKWKRTDGELSGLADASEIWGLFAVAQSEYYFKVDEPHQPPFAEWGGAEVKEPGARDYLWYMGWTARMRRFRLSFEVDGKSADGESGKDSSEGGGSEGGGSEGGGGDASSVLSAAGTICEFVDSSCADILRAMTSYDGLFLH